MARTLVVIMLIAGFCIQSVAAETPSGETWLYKKIMVRELAEGVPGILKTQDPATGRFGTGIWIVTDQNAMWPLAVAWSLDGPDNPHYHSDAVLEAIMKAGDALIEDQDANGMWEFRKKDGSTWGPIYMPWTYSRWIRSYAIIKDAMPPARRERWVKALTLGFTGIAKTGFPHLDNIPTHHAMGLYCAGKTLGRPEWCEQAKAFLTKIAERQNKGGFWVENFGPVVGYNFVYMDAFGSYYGMSGDKTVLPALTRGSLYHANFTYPNGTAVETVDERQVYHETVVFPNVGFTFSPEGRGYLKSQTERLMAEGKKLNYDGMASILYYGEEGTWLPTPGEKASHHFVLGDNDAVIHREGPWFVSLSSYHTAVPASRWIQDRQNFISLFHDKTGLILGGGNTKLQPFWSTFCAGNPALLKHTPGDEEPNFIPPPGVCPVPDDAKLDPTEMKLSFNYDGVKCAADVDILAPGKARLVFTVDADTLSTPTIANVTFLPKEKAPLACPGVKSATLKEDEPFNVSFKAPGEAFEYAGVRLYPPAGSRLQWPVYGHNPYKKAGEGSFDYARLVLTMDFSKENPRREVIVEIPEGEKK